MAEYTAFGIVIVTFIWFLLLITSFFRRREQENQRYLDCIMTLVDKEKAVISTSVTAARKRSEGLGKDGQSDRIKAAIEARRKRIRQNNLWESVSAAGSITPDQEKELNE